MVQLEVTIVEKLEEVVCNICESKDCSAYLMMDGYSYQKCNECGLVYQNPRPVFDDLRKRYRDNYFEYEIKNQENFFNLMKLGLRDIGFDLLFPEGETGRSFLDIGCATGLLLNHMKHRGWKTKGVEICRESVEYATEQFDLDLFIGTLPEAAFEDRSFDVVHFSHLIEHVSDPKTLLLEVKRILKPHGHVILTTPNVDGFQAKYARTSWRSAIPDHVYLFSKKTMRLILGQTGFKIIKQISWGGIPAGKRVKLFKSPADRFAKLFNVGDVMLFHCTLA